MTTMSGRKEDGVFHLVLQYIIGWVVLVYFEMLDPLCQLRKYAFEVSLEISILKHIMCTSDVLEFLEHDPFNELDNFESF